MWLGAAPCLHSSLLPGSLWSRCTKRVPARAPGYRGVNWVLGLRCVPHGGGQEEIGVPQTALLHRLQEAGLGMVWPCIRHWGGRGSDRILPWGPLSPWAHLVSATAFPAGCLTATSPFSPDQSKCPGRLISNFQKERWGPRSVGLAQGFTAPRHLWGWWLEGPLLPQGQITRALFLPQQPVWMGPSLELRGAALLRDPGKAGPDPPTAPEGFCQLWV